MDEKERKEDLGMMKNPDTWLRWPILPMKKIEKEEERPKLGFMLATGKPIVYTRNMYELAHIGVKTVKEIMENVSNTEYASFEAVLDDGWQVD